MVESTDVQQCTESGVIGGLRFENSAFLHCVAQGTQTSLTHRNLKWPRVQFSKLSPSMTPSACNEICMIVEGADVCLHCYWMAEAGHSRNMPFSHGFTQPKSVSSCIVQSHRSSLYYSRGLRGSQQRSPWLPLPRKKVAYSCTLAGSRLFSGKIVTLMRP